MNATLARASYSALLWLATPAYLLRLLWRSRREPLYRHWLGERLGLGRADATGRLWLHAVSLGETRAAAALIDELRRLKPGLRLLLTHGTATGREAGAALLREGDAQSWLPYDTPGAVRRFLANHEPLVGVLMETEVWPNLLLGAAQAGLPMLLANARLSERSLHKGKRFDALMRPAAASIALALAQTEDDARRLRQAGVPEVQVPGNLKFDMAPAPSLLEQGRRWRAALGTRPVMMFAASRDGEEAPLLDAWQRLAQGHPRPLLLLVPRHPQRFDEVEALVRARGLAVSRRSTWGEGPLRSGATPADAWLGDTMGEMPAYYAAANIALLGGSFAPLGGQNLIEAAACGCPLLMGPHTFNFAQAAELALAAGAAERCADIDAAVARALALLGGEAAALPDMARRATEFAARHRGAAARMAEAVLAQIGATPKSRARQNRGSGLSGS